MYKILLLLFIFIFNSLSCFSFPFSPEEENQIHTITYTDANGKVIKTKKMTAAQLSAQSKSVETKDHYYYDKSGKSIRIKEGLRTYTLYDNQGKYMGTYYK